MATILAPRSLASTRERVPPFAGPGKDGLFAPDEHQVAVHVIRNRPGVAEGIGKGKRVLHGADAAVAVIGAAVGHEEAVAIVAVASAGRRQDPKGFWSELVLLGFQFIGNPLDGLIPGDLCKLAVSFGPGSQQRMGQALGRIHPLGRRMGFGAVAAPVQRGFLHALHPHESALFDDGPDTASIPWSAHAAESGDCCLTVV